MRYLTILFLILFCFIHSVSGQNEDALSADAQVSIVTIGPYHKELYAAFGHSAIRVYDPGKGIDLAYNYGTFDYDQPNFYLNFAKGHLLYKLSVQDYKRLRQYYIYYNRFIHEQILDLNQDQKQVVFDFLQNNGRPENASYNYDYFYDNCATRIRDVFVQTLGYAVRFESSHITSGRSIRELTDDYLVGHHPWGDLGIDLCLGLPMDKIMAPSEYMFIPDYIEYAFENGWIKTAAGEKPLVSKKNIVFEPQTMVEKKTIITPTLVFFVFFLVIAFVTRSQNKKMARGRYLDLSIFGVVGLLGIFLSVLWFATDHKAAAGNMNLIWAFPLHFIASFAFLKMNITPLWKNYFRVTAIIMGLLILLWPLLPQMMPTSLMFVSAAIVVRAGYIGWGGAYARANSARE